MSDELMRVDTKPAARQELRIVAVQPEEMKAAQVDLIAWADRRIAAEMSKRDDLKDNLEIAERNRWRTVTLKHEYELSVKRVTAFEKVKAALVDGYVIVPDFPITMFAIRTGKSYPSSNITRTDVSWAATQPDEKAQFLPAGEGEYVNPKPEIEASTHRWTDQQNIDHVRTTTQSIAFQDVEFPFVLAKPAVLDATTRAMTEKIFDEIGVCPPVESYQKVTRTYSGSFKHDPMIIGRIHVPRKGGKTQTMSFMIAWFLDESMLP